MKWTDEEKKEFKDNMLGVLKSVGKDIVVLGAVLMVIFIVTKVL